MHILKEIINILKHINNNKSINKSISLKFIIINQGIKNKAIKASTILMLKINPSSNKFNKL